MLPDFRRFRGSCRSEVVVRGDEDADEAAETRAVSTPATSKKVSRNASSVQEAATSQVSRGECRSFQDIRTIPGDSRHR